MPRSSSDCWQSGGFDYLSPHVHLDGLPHVILHDRVAAGETMLVPINFCSALKQVFGLGPKERLKLGSSREWPLWNHKFVAHFVVFSYSFD